MTFYNDTPVCHFHIYFRHKAKTAKAVNSAWRKAHSKGVASETESTGRATPRDSPAFKGERWAEPSPRGSPKESSTSDSSEEYVIRVTTASEKRSGSDGTVRIVLHGTKRTSEEIPLRKSETHKDKFERGQTDVFRVNLADVGYVQVGWSSVLYHSLSICSLAPLVGILCSK